MGWIVESCSHALTAIAFTGILTAAAACGATDESPTPAPATTDSYRATTQKTVVPTENEPVLPQAAKVAAAVSEELLQFGTADVFISLTVPVGSTEVSMSDRISIVQAQLRSELLDSGFVERVAYANVPAVAGRITSPAAIDVLNTLEFVDVVVLDSGGGGNAG